MDIPREGCEQVKLGPSKPPRATRDSINTYVRMMAKTPQAKMKTVQKSGDVFIRNRIKHMVRTNNSFAFQIPCKMEKWHEVKPHKIQHHSLNLSTCPEACPEAQRCWWFQLSSPKRKLFLWIEEHHPMSMLEQAAANMFYAQIMIFSTHHIRWHVALPCSGVFLHIFTYGH